MLDVSLFDDLKQNEADWMAAAVTGIALADRVLASSEAIQLQGVLSGLTSTDRAAALMVRVKRKQSPVLRPMSIERPKAARIFRFLAEMAAIDNRFTQSEADYLRHIGTRLGFTPEEMLPMLQWARELAKVARKGSEIVEKLTDTTPFYSAV